MDFFGVEITAEQQRGMDEGRAELTRLREAARYEALLSERANSSVGTNCARCARIGDYHAEHQVGFCILLRHQVGTWHNVLCASFEKAG